MQELEIHTCKGLARVGDSDLARFGDSHLARVADSHLHGLKGRHGLLAQG